MATYLIKKNKHKNTIKIKSIKYDLSYKINPKMKDNAYIKITEINLIDHNMIEEVVTKKLLKKYEQVFKLVCSFINDTDDTTSSEYGNFCLGQIEYLRAKLEEEYQQYLSIEKYKYFMNELYMLSMSINKKMVVNQINTYIPTNEYEEEKNRTL